MNGIPIELEFDGDVETIYLATRASGEAGLTMRRMKKEFHRASQKIASRLVRVNTVAARAGALDPKRSDYNEQLEKLIDEQEQLLEAGLELKDVALEAAEEVLRLSLAENYGAVEAERIINVLTDTQISNCVSIIETGEVPEDFFPSRVTRQSESTTLPLDAGRSGSSSDTGMTPNDFAVEN